MFLLYDTILLRQTSLGNSLQARRGDWEEAQRDLLALSSDTIRQAAEQMEAGLPMRDPIMVRLMENLRVISSYNPESFGRKLSVRHKILGQISRWGIPAWWVTINPSDLRNSIVIELAGVRFDASLSRAAAQKIRQQTAIGNPACVAVFFRIIVESFFSCLLRSASGEMGIFGKIVNHFGVVEENGRLALHLHALAWVGGNMEFNTLHLRIREDEAFRARMIDHMESIISESVDEAAARVFGETSSTRLEGDDSSRQHMDNEVPDSILDGDNNMDAESDGRAPLLRSSMQEWESWLNQDSNYIACRHQKHKHTSCCYKYNNPKCRFRFPKIQRPTTVVNELGEIRLARNNTDINKYNRIISSAIRSNNDVAFIPNGARALSVIYYISNYATKLDVKQHQLVMCTAILKRALEDAVQAESPSREQERLRDTDRSKFLMKVWNRFNKEREVGCVLVASYLLGHEEYYTPYKNSRNISLTNIKRRVARIATLSRPGGNVDQIHNTEYLLFEPHRATGSSVLDDYLYRGAKLRHFCFYEYVCQISLVKMAKATSKCFALDAAHPKSATHAQQSVYHSSALATPSIWGSFLSTIHGRSADLEYTREVENDINEALLGLFVPWEDLSQAFKEHAADATKFPDVRDSCSYVWNILEPRLPPYIKRLALNTTYIRKGKEQAELDRKSQQLEDEEWEGNNIADEFINEEEADEGIEQYIPKDIEMPDLLQAWSEVLSKWNEEATKSTIYRTLYPTQSLSGIENLRIQGPSSFPNLDMGEQYGQEIVSV
jgi:hypothetical protein